jgi:glycerophosphoryl diester phosphodiesterase
VKANPFLSGKSRPLVVGHRGVPLLHQENTLAGFRRAVALGVPAIELDVRLTADGVPVLFHDHDVGRLTGGTGIVLEMTWDQLSRLRIRRELYYGRDMGGSPVVIRYAREEPIALLEEVLDELAGKVAINVELKIGLPRWWLTDVGRRTAAALAAAGVEGSVIVTSFDPRKLWAARKLHPALLVGFCFDDTMLDFARPVLDRLPPVPSRLDGVAGPGPRNPRILLERILGANLVGRMLGTRVVGADHTLIGPDTVDALHRRGVAIGTHTLFPLGSTTDKVLAPSASTAAEVDRLCQLGVDWIETDDPERLMPLVM